jgi:hypothetical protein
MNPEMEEEIRQLRMRLDAMETTRRRAPYIGDVSEAEGEEAEDEAHDVEDDAQDHLIKMFQI